MAKANHALSRKGEMGTTMGIASIISILVVLVLVVFSALSITTAHADATLSDKTAASVSSYYEADGKAETALAKVAEAYKAGGDYTAVIKSFGYDVAETEESTLVSFQVEIDEGRALNVKLRLGENGNVSRELWQIVSTREWNPDNSLAVVK